MKSGLAIAALAFGAAAAPGRPPSPIPPEAPAAGPAVRLVPLPSASVGRSIVVPIASASAAPRLGRAHPSDWPKYGQNLEMTNFAAAEVRISPDTVAAMQQLWKISLGGPTASQPTVVGDTVYLGDWSGAETAVDVATGSVKATTNLGTTNTACNPPNLGVTSAAAVGSGTLYVAGGDDFFYALDADTLALRWKTALGDNHRGYYGWCSPALLADGVLQGISSNCDSPFVNGKLVSLTPDAGVIAAAADFSRTTQPIHFGAGVWSSPAVDLSAGTVFVTTASAYHYSDGDAYSIVRLSLPDLAIVDRWKIPLEDYNATPDADWGSSPTLFSDANGRRLVGAGQKDGHYYAFDRENLAAGPIWSIAVSVGGDCPQCSAGTLSTASFDGARLYVGGGTPAGGGSPGELGTVVALDPATGTPQWRYSTLPGPVIAPTSAANGVVFAAGGNTVVALDGATGNVLKTMTINASHPNAGLYGGIAISDGRIFFGDQDGNFYAFGVPR